MTYLKTVEPWELLLEATEAMHGKGVDACDPDSAQQSLSAALESLLEYLWQRDGKELYETVCKKIDEAQARRDTADAAFWMVKRDRLLTASRVTPIA